MEDPYPHIEPPEKVFERNASFWTDTGMLAIGLWMTLSYVMVAWWLLGKFYLRGAFIVYALLCTIFFFTYGLNRDFRIWVTHTLEGRGQYPYKSSK
jgi:hypothetical protein